MIRDAEIRRLAAQAGVDPMVLDLDYSLNWFLAGLFVQPEVNAALIFKGGTCLRKCYFPGYRFSEDLDFTLARVWSIDQLRSTLEAVQKWSVDAGGCNFAAAPLRLEVINDDYGQESYQARIYYRGPLNWGGSPRSIQLDVSRGEHLAFPRQQRPLLHPYSDEDYLPEVQIRCYHLNEMLAEKLRAIGGQRRFAISRDLYDIYHLVQADVSPSAVWAALPAKFAVKSIAVPESFAAQLMARQTLFATDWERRLAHLLPLSDSTTFQTTWDQVLQFVKELDKIGG